MSELFTVVALRFASNAVAADAAGVRAAATAISGDGATHWRYTEV